MIHWDVVRQPTMHGVIRDIGSDEWDFCGARSPEVSGPTPNTTVSFECTRLPGHSGRHAAGTGEYIVMVWDDE